MSITLTLDESSVVVGDNFHHRHPRGSAGLADTAKCRAQHLALIFRRPRFDALSFRRQAQQFGAMLLDRPPGCQQVMLQQQAERPVQGLLGNAEHLDQRADRDVGLSRNDIENAVMRARQAKRRKILVGQERHAAPAVIHELKRRVQIVELRERGAMQARSALGSFFHLPPNQCYPSARNSRRSTFPVAVIGSVSANCTKRGYSWAASCTFTNSWISRASSSLGAKPGRNTIQALIDSVRIGSGMPTTADIATAGCFISVCSISEGPTR